MKLTDNQMYKIKGGVAWYVVAGIGAAISYIIGLFSGYTNPNKCNN